MSTPCSQSLRPNRLVVSEYEVPEVLVSRKWGVFIETLCTIVQKLDELLSGWELKSPTQQSYTIVWYVI